MDNEKKDVIPQPKLNNAELSQRGIHIQYLMQSAMVRESAQPQFDGMGYSMYNQTNEMADMSFLPPKKNKGESRLVTGITHEKNTTILSMLINFNFEVKVRAFDDSNEELIEVSDALTAMVRKSRQIENYDEKRPIIYRNLLVQGTSFTRERYVEQYKPKKLANVTDIDFTQLDKVKWSNLGYEKVYVGCTSDLVDGKKVFLQDIRQTDIRKQPRVFTVEYVPREIAKTVFGKMERWKNVPYTITATSTANYLTLASIYSDWTFAEIDNTKVEVFEVFEPFDNTYQLYLNGVPMLPVGFPLTVVSPSGLIPIAKGDLDPMNLFAYSKSIPAKTKIDQATMDEVVKIMVMKMQQSARPPTGNLSDRILSENIFMPGRITPDVRKEDLPALIDSPGIEPADFSFYQLLNEQIGKKSVTDQLEGSSINSGEVTATQYLDMKKQQMLKLGASIDAVINWEKQMAHLRTINIIQNWTKEFEENIDDLRGKIEMATKSISIDDTFDDGKQGTRLIKFDENFNKTPEEVFDEENSVYQKTGKETRITYLNPKWLRSLKMNFYYEIIPVDKNNDKLTQVIFMNTIRQAMEIFGPQSLNVEYLKRRYAQVFGEDPTKFFISNQGLPQVSTGTADSAAAIMGGEAKMPETVAPTMSNIMANQ